MILFGGATGVLNLVSYCPWNQLREIAPNFFFVCLLFRTSELEKEGDSTKRIQREKDSE